jgi:hypothetical protein
VFAGLELPVYSIIFKALFLTYNIYTTDPYCDLELINQ